jgi:hypothetical protein
VDVGVELVVVVGVKLPVGVCVDDNDWVVVGVCENVKETDRDGVGEQVNVFVGESDGVCVEENVTVKVLVGERVSVTDGDLVIDEDHVIVGVSDKVSLDECVDEVVGVRVRDVVKEGVAEYEPVELLV